MAMCARKDLREDLKRRREVFRKEVGEAFLDELKSRIDRKMVVINGQQERREQCLARMREANRNMVFTR